jgi:predicted Zn-dependent protease
MEYSQQNEFEADKLGVKYVKAAGYDPQGMIGMLEKLQKEESREIRNFSYWKTHPGLSKRISMVHKEITGELTFEDYVNLTGEVEQ